MRSERTLGFSNGCCASSSGGALAIAALVLFFFTTGLIWRPLYVAVLALGIDFVVTGVHGYCPLYKRLGWSTARAEAHA